MRKSAIKLMDGPPVAVVGPGRGSPDAGTTGLPMICGPLWDLRLPFVPPPAVASANRAGRGAPRCGLLGLWRILGQCRPRALVSLLR